MSYLHYLCLWCPTHIVLCFYFVFFSSFCVPYVDSFSGLSIFDCPFGILKRLFKESIFSNSTKHNWVTLSTHNVKSTQLIAVIIIALYITKPYN